MTAELPKSKAPAARVAAPRSQKTDRHASPDRRCHARRRDPDGPRDCSDRCARRSGRRPCRGPVCPAYLDDLLTEINARRARIHSPALAYVSSDANFAVTRYLTDLTPRMIAQKTCFHGQNNPVAPSWDYVTASGFDARVGGEVLGCPGESFFWSPQQIADGWWSSPSHFRRAVRRCERERGGLWRLRRRQRWPWLPDRRLRHLPSLESGFAPMPSLHGAEEEELWDYVIYRAGGLRLSHAP